jgi:hypothetical protein
MEPLRAVPGVTGSFSVQERQGGGNKRQADAFRNALQQEAGSQRDAAADREPALRSRLQVQVPAGRKDQGTARHVDVIA